MVSDCCGEPVRVAGRTTHYYVCTSCGNACDALPDPGPIGSTWPDGKPVTPWADRYRYDKTCKGNPDTAAHEYIEPLDTDEWHCIDCGDTGPFPEAEDTGPPCGPNSDCGTCRG